MSKLKELLQTFCPNCVLSCTFGQVVNYEQPLKYIVKNTDYNDDYETPVLTAGQTFVLGYTNETKGIYNASKESPVIIFDDFTGAFKWVDFPFKVKSSAMKILTANETKVTLRYIYHMMGKIAFTSDEHKRLWIGTYSTFKLPLPSLPVQREIVRILDSFTELTAELTAKLAAELTARRKQYEYYTNILLSFDKETPFVQLRNISDFRNGKGHEKDIVADGKYIVVNSKFISTSGEVKKYSNKQICPLYTDDIVMVMSDLPNGRALAKCFIVEENDKYSLNQRIGAFHVKDENIITTKFLYYVLNRNRQLLRYDNGVDQTNLRKDDILDIQIPLLSISEQKHIVTILDYFDILCNDLISGLSAEIKARQKQYEHYRDKLLTFRSLEKGGKD